jgi:hypothetical protein
MSKKHHDKAEIYKRIENYTHEQNISGINRFIVIIMGKVKEILMFS